MPGVARAGDSGLIHCSSYVIASGSPNVLVNGRPAARVGDASSLHLKPIGKSKCAPHVAVITSGSPTVLINGRPAARIGSGLADCTRIVQGSTNVIVGS